MLVQTLGGFNVQEAEAYAEYVRETSGEEATKLPPYHMLPMQALDHGYLLVFGIAAALCKTVTVSYSPQANTAFLLPQLMGGHN